MSVFQHIAERFKPKPTDVNGIDFGQKNTKVVRLRKSGDDISLSDIELLPPIDLMQESSLPSSLSIPVKSRANYASLAVDVPGIIVKLLTVPGAIDESFNDKLARNLGLHDDTTDRIGYRILKQGSGRSESRILAVAMPESAAHRCAHLFATGLPAPWRLGSSVVDTLTAFEAGPVAAQTNNTIAILDFSAKRCCFSIFHKASLVLFRTFEFGMENVFNKISTTLNVDRETATNILADEAFDISDLLQETLQPLFTQLVVSRDFIERRDNCSLQSIHLCGAFSQSDTAMAKIEQALNTSVLPWDPFRIPNLSVVTSIDDVMENQKWRFAPALGAALAAFEEEE